jgi:hypothetical protein
VQRIRDLLVGDLAAVRRCAASGEETNPGQRAQIMTVARQKQMAALGPPPTEGVSEVVERCPWCEEEINATVERPEIPSASGEVA